MDAIGGHQVVIIAGDTGWGKVNSGTGLKKSLTELIVQQLSCHFWAILHVSKIDLIHD